VGQRGRIKPVRAEAEAPQAQGGEPWLRKAYSQSLQNEVFRVFKNLRVLSALKRNGRKVGRLRFKGAGWFKSFVYPQSGFKLENGKLILSKVGGIPIRLHREIVGRVKGVIVKRERSGRWFAIFQVEDEVNPRGTSQNVPDGFDRDYVAARRILSLGLGRPEVTPVEMGPPRELVSVPASTVVESGSPHPFTVGGSRSNSKEKWKTLARARGEVTA
jgi:transposase